MNGTILRFYVHENRSHHRISLFEWLLEQAKKMGIHGGSAFRAMAAFGRHDIPHEEYCFELSADTTVEVEFVVSDEEAEKLLALLRQERVSIFFTLGCRRKLARSMVIASAAKVRVVNTRA